MDHNYQRQYVIPVIHTRNQKTVTRLHLCPFVVSGLLKVGNDETNVPRETLHLILIKSLPKIH